MASWRDAAGKQESAGNEPAWRLSSGAEPDSKKSPPPRRRTRLVRGILSGSGAIGALVLLYLLTDVSGCRQAHMYVTSAGAEYSHPAFPEIVFGEDDAQTLEQTGQINARLEVEVTSREIDFGTLYQGSQPDETLIVYLSAHGTADSDGALLYPDSFDPDGLSSGAVMRAESLWNGLGALPERQKKVVLLDVMRSPFNSRLGFFENRFLDGLEERVRQIPNLYVITACSTGETNWTSPQFGHDRRGGSVFGHFVALGLQGDADELRADGRVTVYELFDFVHRRVNSWVRQNRHAAGQHPLLFPMPADAAKDDTFKIVSVTKKQQAASNEAADETPTVDEPSTGESLESLSRAWEELDAMQQDVALAPYHLQPVRWRLAQKRLMEAEQWLVRFRPDRAAPLIDGAREDIEAMRRTGRIDDLLSSSESDFGSRNLLAFLPGERKRKPAAPGTLTLLPQQVEALLKNAWTPPAAQPRLAELQSVFAQVESASHPAAGSLPLIRSELDRASEQRRIAFDQLMLGHLTELHEAEAQTSQACETIERISFTWQKASHTLNRAQAQLPELFRWSAARHSHSSIRQEIVNLIVDSLDRDQPVPVDLSKLAALAPRTDGSRADAYDGVEVELLVVSEQTRELQALLFEMTRTGSVPDPVSDPTRLADEINKRLDGIRSVLQDAASNFPESQQYHADQWRELRDLLRVPLLSPDVRVQRLNQQRTVAGHLFEADLKPTSAIEAAEPPAPLNAIWRALCSIRSLSLGEEQPHVIDDLQTAWRNAWRDRTTPRSQAIIELGQKVRRAWYEKRKLAAAQFGSQPGLKDLRQTLFRADQAARTLHPADCELVVSDKNPAAQLRQFYLAEQSVENARRYAEDFWADWYSSAATASLNTAGSLFPEFPESQIAAVRSRLQELETATVQLRVQPVQFGTLDQAEVTAAANLSRQLPTGSARLRAVVGEDRRDLRSAEPLYELTSAPNEPREQKIQFLRDGFDQARCPQELTGRAFAFFRGHQWSDDGATFSVLPCRPKGIRFPYTPAPPTGSVIITGVDRRPILFVLDGSGSMTQTLTGNNLTRLNVAKDSLFAVLNTIAKVNAREVEKRQAAFYAFGHIEGPAGGNGKPTFPPRRLKTWLGNQSPPLETVDVELIKRLQQVLLDSSQFSPAGNTMLLESIRDCCEHFRDVRQSGLILAITDGADSYVETGDSRATSLARQIAALRQSAAQDGVELELHVVAFDVKQQDAALLRQLQTGQRDRFFNAPDARKLADALKEATDPRPYTIKPLTRRTGDTRIERLGIKTADLLQGRYEIRFGAIHPFEVEIRGDELLRYQLADDRLSWQTLSVSEPPLARVPAVKGERQLAVTRFEVNLETAQAIFNVSLLPRDSSTLFQPRPDDIRFQITPLTETRFTPRPIYATVLTGRSVPSWQVAVSDWPGRSGASVTAHWNDSHPRGESLKLDAQVAQSVPLGSIAGQERVLKLTSVEFPRSVPGSSSAAVQIQCRLDPPLSGPSDDSVFTQLAGLGLHLQLGDKRLDVAVVREVIEEEGEVHASFTGLPLDDPSACRLIITPWSRRAGAADHNSQPLVLAQPQN